MATRRPVRSSADRPEPARAPAGQRPPAGRRYWLFKSEPGSYSFAQLERERRTFWSGVRNYQARNLLRDEIQVDDGVLFYHSNADPMAIVGVARVIKAGYPDHTAFEPGHAYHDPDSDPAEPTWFMVDVEAVGPLQPVVTRDQCKQMPQLASMVLLQRGSRLSVQPVAAAEWQAILRAGGARETW